jgi:hypothetical protein
VTAFYSTQPLNQLYISVVIIPEIRFQLSTAAALQTVAAK